jgi:hypothetical protein
VAALKTQKALVTNGPFITVRVNGDKGMGEIADGRDGDADVEAAIQAAPWVQINEVNLIVNGEVRKTWIGNNASLAKITEKVTTPRDAFIIIEVKGDQSMWPVVVPLEIPSLQVSDALGSLAGGFGVNLAPFGALQPKRESVVYPYAFTNPVYVDADGDGKFQGPGVSRQELVSASETAPRASAKKLSTRAMPALVRLFATFAAHDH